MYSQNVEAVEIAICTSHVFSLGKTAYGALSEWFKSDGNEGSYIDNAIETSACNPSCCTTHCHKCNTVNDIINSEKTNLIHNYRKPKIKRQDHNNDVRTYSHDCSNHNIAYYSSATGKICYLSYTMIIVVSNLMLLILLPRQRRQFSNTLAIQNELRNVFLTIGVPQKVPVAQSKLCGGELVER